MENTKKITLYSTLSCAFCAMVEKYLVMKNISYEKVLLDDNPTLRQQLFEKTGAMTVPITTDGEQYVVGYNLGALQKIL